MSEAARGQTVRRVSPVKPALRGARNWTTAQLRAASYSRKGFTRLVLSILVCLSLLTFLALWMAGLLPTVRDGLGAAKRDALMGMGFRVERVDVIGEGRLDESAVRAALGVYPGEYFFGADLGAAQARVESLPWVEHVVVRRLWPDRIVVQLVEKRPYARWQKDGIIHLVDERGEMIGGPEAVVRLANAHELPLVVGGEIEADINSVKRILAGAPEGLSAIVSVGERWDIVLRGEVRVKLPATGLDHALRQVAQLHRETSILDREVAALDMRLPDRIGIVPTGGSAS